MPVQAARFGGGKPQIDYERHADHRFFFLTSTMSMTVKPCSAPQALPLPMIPLCLSLLLLLVSANAFVPLSNGWTEIQRAPNHKLQHRIPSLHASTSSDSNEKEFSVQVTYEGRSCEIHVRPYETLLAAMERSGAADRLCLPSLPSDCRRGNCLTCSARHVEGSKEDSLARGEDGLSPHMSREVKKAGYLLTCSSFVVGDSLKVQLGEKEEVWENMYRERLEDERAVHIGRVAKARVIRRAAESNVPKWTKQTEEVLDQTDS